MGCLQPTVSECESRSISLHKSEETRVSPTIEIQSTQSQEDKGMYNASLLYQALN
jgi:hypothetical protein